MAEQNISTDESKYPSLEQFVETATSEEVESLLASIKSELSNLKGPLAEKSQKVALAIATTEELLRHLLEIRNRLESEVKSNP